MPIINCAFFFPPWYFSWGYKNKIICLSIFLITGVFVGFPALLWALRVLYHHLKSGGRIPFIAVYLLLTDLLELILIPIIAAYIFKEDFVACTGFNLLFGARVCGHLLHQLVALENIVTQKYPSHAVIFSPACSVTLCIIVWVVAMGIQLISSENIFEINMCLCVLPIILCAVTCIVTCKAPPDTSQPTDSKPEVLVLSVGMFTLIVLYVPFFLTYFFRLPFMVDCLISIRLISEPLLCVLIYKDNHLVENKHFAAQ